MKHESFIGKNVKLVFDPTDKDPKIATPERMWVLIKEDLGGGEYHGILNNDPRWLKSVKAGDVIHVYQDQIVDILDETNLPENAYDEYKMPYEKRHIHSPRVYMHENNPNFKKFTKIVVDVDEEWLETYLKEELLVEEIGERKYKIKCIPICVIKLCYNDIISFLPDSFFDYTIQKSDFTSVKLFVENKDFGFLEPYKDYLVIEESFKDTGYISIAYNESYQQELQPLINLILKGEACDYFVKG
jgi:hypothetical protein